MASGGHGLPKVSPRPGMPDHSTPCGRAGRAGRGEQGAGRGAQGAGRRVQGAGRRAQGAGRRAQGAGRRAQGAQGR
jgi:hypothetical protein